MSSLVWSVPLGLFFVSYFELWTGIGVTAGQMAIGFLFYKLGEQVGSEEGYGRGKSSAQASLDTLRDSHRRLVDQVLGLQDELRQQTGD